MVTHPATDPERRAARPPPVPVVAVLLVGWLGISCGEAPLECPDGMVHIPGGAATLGGERPRGGLRGPTAVALSAYCIDTYEFPNQAGSRPRAHVTWPQAASLCAEVGKRLCTEDEWERACRGPENLRYSYGDVRDPTRCNTPIDGTGPGPGGAPVAVSGAHPGCHTSEGVFDLNGNLSEWTSDGYAGPPEPFNRSATPTKETWRVVRGGTMWNETFYGQDCLSRHGHDDSFKNMDDGFRCCADPR